MGKLEYFCCMLLLVLPHLFWGDSPRFWPTWALFASSVALYLVNELCNAIRASSNVIRIRAELPASVVDPEAEESTAKD